MVRGMLEKKERKSRLTAYELSSFQLSPSDHITPLYSITLSIALLPVPTLVPSSHLPHRTRCKDLVLSVKHDACRCSTHHSVTRVQDVVRTTLL